VMVNSTSCCSFSSFHSCNSLWYCLINSCWYTWAQHKVREGPDLKGLSYSLTWSCVVDPTFPRAGSCLSLGIWVSYSRARNFHLHPSLCGCSLLCISGPHCRSWHALRPSGSLQMGRSLQELVPLPWDSQIPVKWGKEFLEFHRDGIGWEDVG
jgi:hypothetical protein